MKKVLLLGVILFLFLLPFPAAADDFDLEVSIVRSIDTFTVDPVSGWSYSEDFALHQDNYTIYRIPKNQYLGAGISVNGSRYNWSMFPVSNNLVDLSETDEYYQITSKLKANILKLTSYYASASINVQIIVPGSGFLSSDPFAYGWQYRFVPVSDSIVPLQGNYDFHITSDYEYSALILYSISPISDFGDLTSYFDSASEIELDIQKADRLFYDISASDIVLSPDYYTFNLPFSGHSYLFRNVPPGNYHINGAFSWNHFVEGSIPSVSPVCPYVSFYDDTQGQAQQAVLDIWERYEDGDITFKQAIDQLDTLIQIMIETSDSDQEKIYWITYQKTIVDRIQSEESDRRRRADVESALSGFEEALESKDQSSGNRFVDQLSGVFGNALPTASYTSLLSPLVSAISYSGVGGGFTFPAITIPKLSFTDQEYTLNDEMYVDFGEYVELFPEPLLIVVRCLIVIGLYLWAFFEMKDLIFQVFAGGDKD